MNKSNSLHTFHYQGINLSNQCLNGTINAPTLILAKVALGKQGITPIQVHQKYQWFKQRIPSKEIGLFTVQLATMTKAGIPLLQSIEMISKGQRNKRFQKITVEIKAVIEAGHTLTEALMQHPSLFNPLFCNVVHVGEQSGTLDILLTELAIYSEKVDGLKRQLKQALTYPLAILIVAFFVCLGLFVVVVPQFEALFHGFGAQLPLITRMVIHFSKWIQSAWYGLILVVVLFNFIFYTLQKKSLYCRQRVEKLLLILPIIGVIQKNAAIARFTRTLAISLSSGIPLMDALQSVAGTTGLSVYSDATLRVRNELATGQALSIAMGNTQIFPHKVIQTIAIGEESGRLDELLTQIASWYEQDVDTAIAHLSHLLEPFIMVILGLLVGGLVVSMYLPIFKLSSVI